MTLQEILNSSITKTAKAFKLYDLGYTRTQVAELITAGNYGFAHNIWKKWNAQTNEQPTVQLPFEFTFNRTFGIELEIYGPDRSKLIRCFREQGLDLVGEGYNHTTRNHWKIVSDSSIRGNNGNEIVSPVLIGHEGMEQVKKACIALNKAGAKANKSCGFHLHLGANDFSLENFKTLAKNHINVEAGFDAIVPRSRRANNNSYCKSIASYANSQSAAMRKIDASTTVNGFMNVFTTRYMKVNFKSYVRQGTVEFRQHSGTTTFSKVRNWIMICGRLMEYSKQNRISNNLNDFLNESLQDYCSDRAVDLAV